VAHLGVRLVEQVLALEHHLPADDARRRRQQAQDGERKRALAGTRFTDDAERPSRLQAERHVVHGAHHSGALLGDVVGRQVLKRQQRLRRHGGLHS
jgi:hypothetical protein